VFGTGSPGEQLFADEAPAHVLTHDKEHLADLVSAEKACVSSGRGFPSSTRGAKLFLKVLTTQVPLHFQIAEAHKPHVDESTIRREDSRGTNCLGNKQCD